MITEELANQLQEELKRALLENNQLQHETKVYAQYLENLGFPDPKRTPLGLLLSMALRRDNTLLAPKAGESLEERTERIKQATTMSYRMVEEIVGNGFWSREREAWYVSFFLDPSKTITAEELMKQNPAKRR